jgi:hypothetical protein
MRPRWPGSTECPGDSFVGVLVRGGASCCRSKVPADRAPESAQPANEPARNAAPSSSEAGVYRPTSLGGVVIGGEPLGGFFPVAAWLCDAVMALVPSSCSFASAVARRRWRGVRPTAPMRSPARR